MDDQAKKVFGEYLQSRIAASAAGYRAIAEKLDLMAAEVPGLTMAGQAAALAQRALHEVMWGAANASPDAIITAAADYDRNVTSDIPQ